MIACFLRPMPSNRIFVSTPTLDQWLEKGRIEVAGETMTLKPEGQQFRLKTAVHILKEVAGGGDAAKLVGRVKDIEQLEAMGAEHVSDSVVLNDDAYEVVEGFVGEPILGEEVVGNSLAAATRAAVGDRPPSGEIDLLARFFLSSR